MKGKPVTPDTNTSRRVFLTRVLAAGAAANLPGIRLGAETGSSPLPGENSVPTVTGS